MPDRTVRSKVYTRSTRDDKRAGERTRASRGPLPRPQRPRPWKARLKQSEAWKSRHLRVRLCRPPLSASLTSLTRTSIGSCLSSPLVAILRHEIHHTPRWTAQPPNTCTESSLAPELLEILLADPSRRHPPTLARIALGNSLLHVERETMPCSYPMAMSSAEKSSTGRDLRRH